MGAEVIVTPTNVPADSPDSYYETAKRIARETPGAYYLNQYHNPLNIEAHYKTTGPEIWRDCGGEIDYFVAGIGVRHWTFDEGGCQGLDSIRFKVCNPMEEFLSDQFRPVVRLGVGYRKRLGAASWVFEIVDFAGPFHGAGLQGAGGVQNDFLISTGISFPRG